MAGRGHRVLQAWGVALALAIAPAAWAVPLDSTNFFILPLETSSDEVPHINLGSAACDDFGESPFHFVRLSEALGDYTATIPSNPTVVNPGANQTPSDPLIFQLDFDVTWNGTVQGIADSRAKGPCLLFAMTDSRQGENTLSNSNDILESGFQRGTLSSTDLFDVPPDPNDPWIIEDTTGACEGGVTGDGCVDDGVGMKWIGVLFPLANGVLNEFSINWGIGEPFPGPPPGVSDSTVRIFNGVFILVPEPGTLVLLATGLGGLLLLGRRRG